MSSLYTKHKLFVSNQTLSAEQLKTINKLKKIEMKLKLPKTRHTFSFNQI